MLWLGASVAVVAAILLANALLPSHGPPRVQRAAPTGPLFTTDVAERAAAERSANAARPLADRFVDDVLGRHDLDEAWQMLSPKLRERYSLADWREGRGLPLNGAPSSQGGASLAFAGARTAGFVVSYATDGLVAMRLDKVGVLGWRIAYLHTGQSSRYVTAANYSPSGFTPGSRRETLATWLVLVGGLVALVAVVALIDRRLGG